MISTIEDNETALALRYHREEFALRGWRSISSSNNSTHVNNVRLSRDLSQFADHHFS